MFDSPEARTGQASRRSGLHQIPASAYLVDSTLQLILASQQDIEGMLASVEQAQMAVRASEEAVRKSRALLSIRASRPEPLLPAQHEMERWRIATQVAQALK